MGVDQRNAIRRALNEDADKLIQECDPNDPQLRRLRQEIDEVNRLFDEFERRADANLQVPGDIFAIPPPYQEAIDAVEKLKCQYERCIVSLAEETNAHAAEHNIRHHHGCEELGPGAVHRDGR